MTQTIETAVILAAGRGTRLQPYTFDIPKGFMPVGDERLIERSVRLLKENGIKNVIIGTGHLHEHYEKFAQENGLTTFLSPDFATTGSFHTLIYGSENIKGDFLLLEAAVQDLPRRAEERVCQAQRKAQNPRPKPIRTTDIFVWVLGVGFEPFEGIPVQEIIRRKFEKRSVR